MLMLTRRNFIERRNFRDNVRFDPPWEIAVTQASRA